MADHQHVALGLSIADRIDAGLFVLEHARA